MYLLVFFLNDPATTEIYTLSYTTLFRSHRPPTAEGRAARHRPGHGPCLDTADASRPHQRRPRSEEHTSELQSRQYLVCRLLLEKKKNKRIKNITVTHTITYERQFTHPDI